MDDYKYGIAWDDSLIMGNEEVDSQHHEMFALLSSLVSACGDGTENSILKETLDFLVNYTVKHFHDEEALQLRYGYPAYERHRQMHEDFKITVNNLVQRFSESGSSSELSSDINKIVVRWLTNHILDEDKKIGVYIQSLIPGKLQGQQ